MHPIRSLSAFALAAVAALSLSTGCSTQTTEPVPVNPDSAPTATSPVNALRRLQWAWVHRDTTVLRGLITSDFEFVFGELDSTGHSYVDPPWNRNDELASSRHLFVTGCAEPPATSISVTFDPSPRTAVDTRPGHRNAWHRVILTTVALTCRTEASTYETQGRGVFFFVRGDSAAIPPDAAAAGARPDSTLWWIDRWEDQTVSTGGALSVLPARSYSWGHLKALYR